MQVVGPPSVREEDVDGQPDAVAHGHIEAVSDGRQVNTAAEVLRHFEERRIWADWLRAPRRAPAGGEADCSHPACHETPERAALAGGALGDH